MERKSDSYRTLFQAFETAQSCVKSQGNGEHSVGKDLKKCLMDSFFSYKSQRKLLKKVPNILKYFHQYMLVFQKPV